MAYTLTQARKLLTAAELTVFDASRASTIRELTPARLRAKVTRARALRDKFRDLHRRQTVATRSAPASKRSAMGGDNERTLQKADLFAEVLSRFEERMLRVEADAAAAERKAPARKSPASKATAKKAPVKKAPAQKVPVKKAAAKKPAAQPVSLQRAVAKALKIKNAANGSAAPEIERSAKAPAALRGARSAGPAPAPIDVTPATQRGKALRDRSDMKAIQAHASSQGRRMQGKRDAR
jgi:hypothetical protein